MPTDAVLSTEPLGFPWKTQDPFLFCAYHRDLYPRGNARLGPDVDLGGRRLGMDFEIRDGFRMYHGDVVPGFPRHPHRGFETITVVKEGLVDHSDSLGATARIGAGDVQWMTAGRGIEHAEMFPLVRPDDDNPLELFQVWLNLPRRSKRVAPYFSMFWNENVPRLKASASSGPAAEVTVVAGRFAKESAPPPPPPDSWAADKNADIAIWTISLPAGGKLKLPPASSSSNRTLYFYRGAGLSIDAFSIDSGHSIDVRADASVELTAHGQTAEIFVLQGRPIGEPVVHHGPFVMNTSDEIVEAIRDYRAGRFGPAWPWPDEAPNHKREAGRFAKHPDGRIDRPKRG